MRAYLAGKGIHFWETGRGETYLQVRWATGKRAVRDATTGRIAALLPGLQPQAIDGLRVTGYDRTDGLRFLLEGGAWALIRLSGTEPLMRIYTEVREGEQVQPVLQAVRELTGA